MADSFQKEKPPSRINLFLELQEGEAKESVELPMRLLVLGDYTGRDDDTPVGERDLINIDSNNFESVMQSQRLSTQYVVRNRLDEDGDDLEIGLSFENMNAFSPEQVARQVPELRRMVAMRNLLQDLRNRVVSTSEFRKQLEAIVQDEDALSELAAELQRVVTPGPSPTGVDENLPEEVSPEKISPDKISPEKISPEKVTSEEVTSAHASPNGTPSSDTASDEKPSDEGTQT